MIKARYRTKVCLSVFKEKTKVFFENADKGRKLEVAGS